MTEPQSTVCFQLGTCSLGAILVAMSESAVCAISLGDNPEELVRELTRRFPNARRVDGPSSCHLTMARIAEFIETPTDPLELPLVISGTPFQRRVWQALQEIPSGERVSYSELARRIGAPNAVRAVGSACGANTLAVAIPCHRAVRADGRLSGYRWGIARKAELLRREQGNCPNARQPGAALSL